jgi:pyruvate,water dikinase
MIRKHIVWFEEVGKEDIDLVGGKGANLGEMTNAHIPVPYGFIVTANAYFQFIKEANVSKKIENILSIVNFDNPNELHEASKQIQHLITQSEMPHQIAREIVEYYDNLTLKEEKHFFKKNLSIFTQGKHKLKSAYSPPLVAVRSSATAEDLLDASFAGQQETYLNIKGEALLLKKVKECWASLFTERAMYYRHQLRYDHFKVGLATVVQRMVESDKSGIAFSIDPVTNDKNKIVIEAIFGLGEYIVQGKVTPDHYEVDKRSFVILKKEIKYQNIKYVKANIENKEIKLNHEEGTMQKLTDKEIEGVAVLVKDIEDHYFFPQDTEWAIENGKVYIVQTRPITTIATTNKKSENQDKMYQLQSNSILSGAPASPGIGVGPVKIIHSPAEIDKIHKGDVLVAPQTSPDYVPAMKKASAIITEKGGRTSHAAIVSRELGIPAVVGAEHATHILKNDMVVSVDGKMGEVYRGSILSKKQLSHKNYTPLKHHYKTLTHVYVNLAEPENAEEIAQRDVDGVGMLRAESMIVGIGEHPKEFIKQGKQAEFIHRLTSDLEKFVKPFNPRPIIYQATDFKTNEYRRLKNGEHYELKEENPMLGFRGASRFIANPDVFALELQAILNIWNKGYRNLHITIPFIRAPWELIKIKNIMNEYGMFQLPGFKLLITVEVPAAAFQLEEFISIGIDGVSIDTNNLTMMLMGVDRDNQEVSHIYDERTPAVLGVLDKIVKTCAKAGISCSMCGQAASNYPDLVEQLVKAGITSVSVNPDSIERTRELVYNVEKKVFSEHLHRS